MAVTNTLIRHAVKPEQGVGFYEMPDDTMPYPETGGGCLLIYDSYSQLHGLILDCETGLWYDITTREGIGAGVTKLWTDKNGEEFEREVWFAEDVSETEDKFIRTSLSSVFVRPLDPDNRGASGYDADGYPSGLNFCLDFYIDGEQITPTTKMKNISVTGELKTDRKVEGNRIMMGLRSSRGDHLVLNRKNVYIASDKAPAPSLRISSEMDYQEELAAILIWLDTSNNSIIDRASGNEYDTDATIVDGPGDLSDTAINFTGSIDIGDASSSCAAYSFWAKGSVTITINGVSVTPTANTTLGDWTLYYTAMPSWATSGAIVISGTNISISDFRVYSAAVSSDALTYYCDDIDDNDGKIVLSR